MIREMENTTMLDLKAKMKLAMEQALTASENRLEDGTVNWNFVDADVYMDVYGRTEQSDRDDNLFYQFFDELAFEMSA
jgi:hypothetical protein